MKRPISIMLMTTLACVLCLGQTCAPSPSSSGPTEAGQTSIPAGSYAGQLTANIQVLLNGTVQRSYSASFAFTTTFAQGGVLTLPNQGTLSVGDTQTLVMGDVTLTITVDSVETLSNGLNVGYSVVAVTQYNGSTVTLNGSGQIGFTASSSGVAATFTFDTSYALYPFVTLGVHIDSNGTLTPQ